MNNPPDRCESATNLFLATPTYTGMISMETEVLKMQGGLSVMAAGIALQGQVIGFDCYVPRVRNELVTEFLNSTATDLLFIDSDVGADPSAILKIAVARRPFIAGIYPMKRWGTADVPEFPVRIPTDYQIDEEGLFQFDDVIPAGFLRLNRAVFDYMPYKVYEVKGKRQLGFFNTEITGDTFIGLHHAKAVEHPGRFVGEDVRFSQEWLQRGGHIWLMPNITFSHSGPGRWEANLHQCLMQAREAKE